MSRNYLKPWLTNVAVKYENPESYLIANNVSPFVPVATQTGQYPSYTQKDRYTIPDVRRGARDTAHESSWGMTWAEYACKDYAQKDLVTNAEIHNAANQNGGNASPMQPKVETTEVLVRRLQLAREQRIATQFTTAANYAATNRTTLTGSDPLFQLDDYVNSDPFDVFTTARRACMFEPNIAWMGVQVYDKIIRHPKILEVISGGATIINPALVRPEMLAQVMEVDAVYVGKARYNSTPQKSTMTSAYLWGKYIGFAYVPPTTNMKEIAFAKTFMFTPEGGNQGWRVREYEAPERGGGAVWIEVDQSFDENIIANDVGYLISAAIS